MGRVSYSQYSKWATCPYQYKLDYIDGLKEFKGNAHTAFGTSVHETIQSYLDVFYNVSKKAADEIDLEKLLLKNFKKEYATLHEGKEHGSLITREEMSEFYWDGVQIIKWFKRPKNQAKFFNKKGYELVGIEKPINIKVAENVNVIGFVDVVIKEIATGKITIIDLKTSTRGWNKWARGDDSKKNQILLYRKWYSEQYGVPIDKINVEFHIMRRKVPDPDTVDYPIPRISKFVPASGTVSMNKATRQFNEFLTEVFDADGNYRVKEYHKRPGKACDWCPYLGTHCDGKL